MHPFAYLLTNLNLNTYTMKCPLIGALALALTAQSCATVSKTMREPSTLVELSAEDFEFSSQVSAEAKVTTVLGIFTLSDSKRRSGHIDRGFASSATVFGLFSGMSRAEAGAVYELMEANPGYDVVFYPQFTSTTKPGLLLRRETVQVKARLAKLK